MKHVLAVLRGEARCDLFSSLAQRRRKRGLVRVIVALTLFNMALATLVVFGLCIAFWPHMFPRDWFELTWVSCLVALTLTVPVVWLDHRIIFTMLSRQDDLEHELKTDFLTGVLTRRAFEREGRELMARTTGVLLLMDVDHFKVFNDSYGHEYGDRALVELACCLRRTVGPDDIVGRIGGEEFGVYMPGATVTQGREMAERIRRNVQLITNEQDGAPVALDISVSVGGVPTAAFGGNFEVCLRRADDALYEAKNQGRNCVVFSPVGSMAA